MKKRLNKIKLMAIFVGIIEILCLVEFSYSRFKSTRAGDLNGRVLKWHFELVDGIQETEEIDFPITRTDDNEDVPEGMIAPGTWGEIPIVIDTTGCETNMECEIELTIENCPTNMMFKREFLVDYEYFTEERIGTGEENDPKIAKFNYRLGINPQNAQYNGILEENLLWEWNYQTDQIIENGVLQYVDINDSDQQDIIDQGNGITFNIKVTGQQIVTSPVYALLKDDTLIFRDYDFSDEEKSTYINYGDCGNENQPAWIRNQDEIVNVNIETPISPRKTDNWFCHLYRLEHISNIENLDTSNVTDMSCMFWDCYSLKELNLSNFDTSNVTNMYGMFGGCSSLTELDLSNFNTSNVTNMQAMFYECSGLTELDLSNFDTSNVENMRYMFCKCSSLAELDVSNFDTSKVTDMSVLFANCFRLRTIYGNNFNVDSLTYGMFSYCLALVGGSGTRYSSYYTDGTYARIDNPPSSPGYFTLKTS